MECPKCKHKIPDKADKCLYCGSWTKGKVLCRTKTEPSQSVPPSREGGQSFWGAQVTKEEIKYEKLEELPESLRAKVEEMLKRGETQSVEIKNSAYSFPPLRDRTSPNKKMSLRSAFKILLKKE